MFKVFKRAPVRHVVREPRGVEPFLDLAVPQPDMAELSGDSVWMQWDQAVQEVESQLQAQRAAAAARPEAGA